MMMWLLKYSSLISLTNTGAQYMRIRIFRISLQGPGGLNKHTGWLIGCPRLVWRGNLQGFCLVDYIFRLLSREAKRQARHTQMANASRWTCRYVQVQVQSVGVWVQAQEGAGASALGTGETDILEGVLPPI